MTLIVGRIVQGVLRIDSDSKITDPNIVSNRNSIFSGLLKTIILNPKISVSYAGDVDKAQEAIERIYSITNIDINVLKKILKEINIESDFQTDFLIASLESLPLLYKISKGNIEVSNQNFWIGDIEGFELFQKEFFPNIKSTDPMHIMDVQNNAFDTVINSSKIESVGGFHITVHTTKNGLEYLMKMKTSMGQPVSFTMTGNNAIVPLNFGNATTGAFSYSYLISSNPFSPAIGIHFPMGNFGTLYYPKFKRSIIFFDNVNPFEFVGKVKQQYKIDLTGLVQDGVRMTMI